jgi:hypothetical protein
MAAGSSFPKFWNLYDITTDCEGFPRCDLPPDNVEKIKDVAVKTISDISKCLPTKVDDKDSSAEDARFDTLFNEAKNQISKEFSLPLTSLTDFRINIYVLGNFFRIAFENDNKYAMEKITPMLTREYALNCNHM